MDKRYQVFVSSTFEDLKEERQAVLRAVLELDHIPAGMELFPATDDDAWQLIREVIDASDYYVLVVGGRYGSSDEDGLGYTEREYDYAISTAKPVIALLHEDPDNLPRERTETAEQAWAKLEAFRAKIEARHTCAYWKGADALKARVIVGLTSAIKRQPAVGWVRTDQLPDEASPEAILALKDRISALEAQLEESLTQLPDGAEELAQGEDEFRLESTLTVRPSSAQSWEAVKYSLPIRPTWNDLFGAVAPVLINEAKEPALREAIKAALRRSVGEAWKELDSPPDGKVTDAKFDSTDLDTILVQLRALGLIRESMRKRSVRDTATYWKLTQYGDNVLVQLRAIRRSATG